MGKVIVLHQLAHEEPGLFVVIRHAIAQILLGKRQVLLHHIALDVEDSQRSFGLFIAQVQGFLAQIERFLLVLFHSFGGEVAVSEQEEAHGVVVGCRLLGQSDGNESVFVGRVIA